MIRLLLALFVIGYLPLAASAVGKQNAPTGTQTPAGTPGASEDANEGTAWTIRDNYFKRFKWAKEFGPEGSDRVNKNGESEGNGQITVQGPIYKWPEKHEGSLTVNLPTKRDEAIGKHMVKTFGLPISDTQFQVMSRLNDNMMLEEAFDPERWMWMENTMGAIKSTSAANSAANLGRNQSQGAIEFAQNFLPNFTVDPANVWNRIRNELFIPMAILLLLPGAVLSQVRAIVAQGTSVLGDVNPFDGIVRSIVAIFLIPATYLVVNYGIDVSNAITAEIGKGYERVFGGNMYTDAACAQRRAFPIRNKDTNKNQIPTTESTPPPPPAGKENDPFAQLEALSFDVGASEECGKNNNQQQTPGMGGGGRKLSYEEQRARSAQGMGTSETSTRADKAPVTDSFGSLVGSLGPQGQAVQQGLDNQGQQQEGQADDGKADEQQRVLMSTQRMVVNGANAALASTWNVLCAFQMAYLYYLFCIGPVVAALWVWPMNQLRGALPSWVEGVVTLCFWSLFWNTTILLMAAFKNVGETGTITMTALNFLATASVKHAFDFAGLVKDAGAQVAKEAEKASKGGGGGKGNKSQGDHGADSSDGGKGGKQPGQNSTDSNSNGGDTAHTPASTTAMSLTPSSSTSPGSTGDGESSNKGLTASDVVPPPGERSGGNNGGTPGTSGNTASDAPGSQGGLAATEAPMSNGGNSGPASSPPPSDGQSVASLAPSVDGGPGGNGGNGGDRGDGGSPQSANASIDISGLTSGLSSSLGSSLSGMGDGGAVSGGPTGANADSGVSGSGGVLAFNSSGGTIDGGTAVPGTGGFARTAAENGTGGGLVGNQLNGGTVDARALSGHAEARGIDGSIVPGSGGQVPGNGTAIPGTGGSVPGTGSILGNGGPATPGVGPGLGIVGDAGLPPVAGIGQPTGGVTPDGTVSPNSNLAAIPGNVLAPPPSVAPVGSDPIVSAPTTQAYQGSTQQAPSYYEATPQAQAQPVQAQPIVSQPLAQAAQPEQFQGSTYQAQPVQPQPVQPVQQEQYQAQLVQPQPIQSQPQAIQPAQYEAQPVQALAPSHGWTFQPIETPVSLAYSTSLAAAASAHHSHSQAQTPEPAPAAPVQAPAPAPGAVHGSTPVSSQFYETAPAYTQAANYAIIPAPAHAPAPAAPPDHHDAHHAVQGHSYNASVDPTNFMQGTRQGGGGGLAAALGRASAPRVPSNGPGNSSPSNPTRRQSGSHRLTSLQDQLGQSGIRNSRPQQQRQYQGPFPPSQMEETPNNADGAAEA